MDHETPDRLPAMSYVTADVPPAQGPAPTDEQIRARAHRIWEARKGAPGNAALDWLQAEMELRAELSRAASEIEARPAMPRRFAPADAPLQRAA